MAASRGTRGTVRREMDVRKHTNQRDDPKLRARQCRSHVATATEKRRGRVRPDELGASVSRSTSERRELGGREEERDLLARGLCCIRAVDGVALDVVANSLRIVPASAFSLHSRLGHPRVSPAAVALDHADGGDLRADRGQLARRACASRRRPGRRRRRAARRQRRRRSGAMTSLTLLRTGHR